MKQKTFKDLELEGWEHRATMYDTLLAPVTQQAIEPMLESLGDFSGKSFLDIACGTGHLAGHAAQRGARATGIDFAEAMVTRAARNYPKVTFAKGDAETLTYPDESFDAAACAFGLMHVGNPETALAEAHRVLHPGGHYAFTVWASPQEGSEYHALVFDALQKYGSLELPLPPAPPFFRFADE